MAYFEGDGLLEAIESPDTFLAPETRAFFKTMDATGPWQPVPLLYALSESGPQLSESHFQNLMAAAESLLANAGPLDGIYVTGHGSVVAESTLDTDATLLDLIRRYVGPDIPIVVTLDLHGKLSGAMLEAADHFIAYRTDPHVDMAARGEEAAHALRRMLAGERPGYAYIRLPMMVATVGIVAPTSPFNSIMQDAVSAIGANGSVSILPSYPLTDTPLAGFHIMCSSWDDPARAEAVCRQAATALWSRREGFVVSLMPLDAFAQLARRTGDDPALPALCFADCADNPGGGGTGSTMDAVKALLAVGARDVIVGPVHAPEIAQTAHRLGVGARFRAGFNIGEDDPFAKPLAIDVEVMGLSDGHFNARRGPATGVPLSQGLTASLRAAGVTIVICERRLQALAVEQFEIAGVNLKAARCVVVKSRGHYKASFGEVFPPDAMLEIDGPGWTSPNLSRWPYRRLTQPLFPLDSETTWNAQCSLTAQRNPRRIDSTG